MRVPTRHLYRAVPELDRFTDEQCRLFVRRVWKTGPYAGTLVALTILSLFLSLVATIVLIAFGIRWLAIRHELGGAELASDAPWWDYLIVAAVIFTLVGVPAIVTLLVRDVAYRRLLPRAVASHAARVCCLRCGYSMVGLIPSNDKVQCPECGRDSTLDELGLRSEDELAIVRRTDVSKDYPSLIR